MADVSAQRKEHAKNLAAGYTMQKRLLEMFSVASFTVLWADNCIKIGRYLVHDPNGQQISWLTDIAPVILGSILVSDFLSGVTHWSLDTWGTTKTAVFGPFIRSFREHHVDQTAMTKHDFIETNGDTTLLIWPFLLIQKLLFLPYLTTAGPFFYHPVFHAYILSLGTWITFTNQTHKSAHEAKQPPLARLLMAAHLILTPSLHRVHHSGEHDQGYCITTGWMNYPLDAIGFWRIAEKVVTKVTGAIPREDDKKLMGFKD